jgi:hypothetical protein
MGPLPPAGLREMDFEAGQFLRRLVADAIKACGSKASAVVAADPSRVAARCGPREGPGGPAGA